MANALAPQRELPSRTHLGDRMQVAAVRQRMASMMQLPADCPDDVVWAAAQLAVAHRLNPFVGELYIIPLGKSKDERTGQWVQQYRPHIGVKGLRAIARRQANFMTDFEIMDASEVQAQRRDLYDPDDVGVRCTLWRLDVARECRDLGIPYRPVTAVGIWRKKARLDKRDNKWMPDNTPETWTAQMVAEKRAEINAIKQAFDIAIDIGDPADMPDDDAVVGEMQYHIRTIEMDQALPAPRRYDVDEDGLYAVETPRQPQPQPEPEEEDFTDADPEHLFDDDASADTPAPPDYAVLAEQLTGNAYTLAKWAKGIHLNSAGPASGKQYNFLAGTLDALTGAAGSHNRILGVLVGRPVEKANPPGARLAKLLLDYLLKERKTEDGGKEPNPNYRQDVADSILQIWQATA